MKISLATPSLLPNAGGPAYSVVRIGESLRARRVRTQYLVVRGRDRVPRGSGLAAWWPSQVDIVHNFGAWTPLNHWACMSSRLCARPLVFCPLGMLEPWSLSHRDLKKRLAMTLYQRRDLEAASVLHATAEQEAVHLRELGLRNPIAVIPHGVDVPGIPEDEQSSSGLRTALFLSRLHPKKGLVELVDAWAALRPRDWQLIVAGPDEGGYRGRVEANVARHGLCDRIRFVGQVLGEAKRELLLSAELFVLPTYSENFGHVVAEALVHRVPVITTTATPWKELSETGSGWWIEPGTDPLIDCLRRAFSLTRAELRAMGAIGRRMIAERYSWERAAQHYVQLYEWLLRGHPKPTFVQD